MGNIKYAYAQGGGVPGGCNVILGREGGKHEGKPYWPNMTECNSIPLRHSDVVVDIGAYVGQYAITCARYPVKKVIACEPSPETFKVLSLTDLPNLELINAAVVPDDSEETEFFVSKGIGVTNSMVTSRLKDTIVVSAVKFETIVQSATIAKIDTEGAEYLFPIVQPQLRAILIDFHPIPGFDWVRKAKEMIQELEAAGFEAVVTPNFANGWTRAGTWMRPMETDGEYEPMMRGDECCGCGRAIVSRGRSLCATCYDVWRPIHRKEYVRAER
jgi:FkbM family methyltransferase